MGVWKDMPGRTCWLLMYICTSDIIPEPPKNF